MSGFTCACIMVAFAVCGMIIGFSIGWALGHDEGIDDGIRMCHEEVSHEC